MPYVAGVGYGEAEEVDEVESHGEGEGLPLGGLAVGAPHYGQETGGYGEGGEYEDEHGCGEGGGEEGGEEVGGCGYGQGYGECGQLGFEGCLVGLGVMDGGWRRGGLEACGQYTPEEGFAKADDEDEVEAGDYEVVGGDVEVGVGVHVHGACYGSHVGYAACVDAYGYGADLGKLVRVGVAAEEEEACHGDEYYGAKAAEGGFEGFVGGPSCQAAGEEHEGYGEGDADVSYEVVGFEEAGLVNPWGEVGDEEAYDVEQGHGADFVYPRPFAGEEHDERRGGEEV